MSKHDLMKDPFYAQILYAIESRIHSVDQAGAGRGVVFTDSLIRSALVRAINTAKGRPPAPVPPTAADKERRPAELAAELGTVRSEIMIGIPQDDGSVVEEPLPAAEWVNALLAVRESCELRGDGRPGSRCYLDFLNEFIKTGKN